MIDRPGTQRGHAPTLPGAAALLAAHVPLSLLMDLADPLGPDSAGLFAAEVCSAEWVLPRQRRAARPAQLVFGE